MHNKELRNFLLVFLLFLAMFTKVESKLAYGESITNQAYPETIDKSLPSISISLPENNSFKQTQNVPFSITIQKPLSWFNTATIHGQLFSVIYYLDNGQKVTLAEQELGSPSNVNSKEPLHFQGILPQLTDGIHSFQVFVYGVSYYRDTSQPSESPIGGIVPPSNYYLENNCTVFFTVDTLFPQINILSIKNIVYSSTDIPLNFITSEPVSKICYSIDNTDNTTINGNITLTDLSNGKHNITLYAWDNSGNIGVSSTIDFSVNVQEKQSMMSIIFPAIVAPIAMGIIIAALWIIIKKMNHKNHNIK